MADEPKYIDEGNRIKEAITRDGRYTQEELAALIPCSYVTLSRYVNGHRLMTDDTYKRVAAILGVRIEYLKNEDDFMFADDIANYLKDTNKKWFNGHISFLETLGCTVTPMLYLKIRDLETLKRQWATIKPTLTAESLGLRFRRDSIPLGEWDGTSLNDLGFEQYDGPAHWDGYPHAEHAFWSTGLRVRRAIEGYSFRQKISESYVHIKYPLMDSLFYVLRYRITYKAMDLDSILYDEGESYTCFYTNDKLISMFEDIDAHIRAVTLSNAYFCNYPDYDDDDAAMDRDEFCWDESEQDT